MTTDLSPPARRAPVDGHEHPAPTGARAQERPLPVVRLQATRGWRPIDWRELFAYRDLFGLFVKRSITVRYKQSVLGAGWALIRPLFGTIIFSVVFGRLAKVPSDGIPYPLFVLAAQLPWSYFAGTAIGSTSSVGSANALLAKVYVPRLIFPLTPAFTNLVDFGVALLLLGGMMAYFGVAPTWGLIMLPLLLLIAMLTAVGIGLWLSGLAVQYRDVNQVMGFSMPLLMYAAPVVWPLSLIGQEFPRWGDAIRLAYGFYPMAGVIEGFRSALFGRTPMPWDLIGLGACTAVVLFVTGAFNFRRMERIFADVV